MLQWAPLAAAAVIPDGVTQITVEGRDQQYGFGGKTVTVKVH